MPASMRWNLHLTAQSSLSHGGDIRGTTTFFRREAIITPTGDRVEVPVISGNSLRGVLRRTGEEMLRDALELSGEISLPAASALRGGGTLTRSSTTPLTGARLAQVRSLVPQLGIFGAALGSVIVDGALSVGKVMPVCAATAHITGIASEVPVMRLTQLEQYSRVDDSQHHDIAAPEAPEDEGDASGGGPMVFEIETLPAGTGLTSWIHLHRPTALEASFFSELLARWVSQAHLGGRVGVGHGQVRVSLEPTLQSVLEPTWRAELTSRRREVLEALAHLS